MSEKGVCLARCTGELHPDPSGWVYLNSEVLEFLIFQRVEQRPPNMLWRPLRNVFCLKLRILIIKVKILYYKNKIRKFYIS